jgi:hypothetical protein
VNNVCFTEVPGENVYAVEFSRQISFADNLLHEVRFTELVDMVRTDVSNAHEAFEILTPLLTRVLRISWNELVPFGASWRDVVQIIRHLEGALADLQDWSEKEIESTISKIAANQTMKPLSGSKILYQCTLSSEYRLPLARALRYLGQQECVMRLNYVCNNLELMNLVG